MKTLKQTLVFLLIGLASFSFAQDLNEAGTAFNDGNVALKGKNYGEAVRHYTNSLDICDMVGDDAAELKGKVETQLAKAYWKNGISLYKSKKFDQAVEQLKLAEKAGNVAGDAKIEKNAKKYVPKVISSKGMGMVKAKSYDDAIVIFNEAFTYNDKCLDAFYGMGLAYKGKGDTEKAITNFDAVITTGGDNPKAAKSIKKAKSAGQKMLEAKAAKELQIEHAKEAVTYLNKANEYSGGSFNAYYLLALANNKTKNFDAAIEAATKGLGFEGGDANSINFELAKAYEGKGDKTNACATYKKVTAGPNVQAAQFQIKEVLKCN